MTLERNFTHVACNKKTKRKIAIMASVQDIRIHDLLRELVDDAWQDLFLAGKVTDAMLESVEREVING